MYLRVFWALFSAFKGVLVRHPLSVLFQVFTVMAQGRRKYRSLEMSTNAKLSLHQLQPDANLNHQERTNRGRPLDPWPPWGRHLAFEDSFEESLQPA